MCLEIILESPENTGGQPAEAVPVSGARVLCTDTGKPG